MRAIILLTILVLSIGITYSQTNCDNYPEDYVPKNLNDALTYLDCKWPAKDKEEFKNKNEREAVTELHFGAGQAIRNNWGLWAKRRNSLVRYFNRLGIHHPDDISSIILTSFHRKLNNKAIDLDKQVESHISYWEKANASYDTAKFIRENKCEQEFEKFKLGDTVKIECKINVQKRVVWVYTIQKYPDLNEKPDCYIYGIIKEKKYQTSKKGKFVLSIMITDICGNTEAIFNSTIENFKVGTTYDFFRLESFKISKK
jgi:hypothetical protein